MSTGRLEAFSDGVFAIAITLLVLEIPVPTVEHGGLAEALLDEWPAYAAYVVSFAIIGIIWINHHAVLGYVERLDRGLLFLNLNIFLWVALIPWPTSLLAEYMQAGGSDERVAALVYALTMTLMGSPSAPCGSTSRAARGLVRSLSCHPRRCAPGPSASWSARRSTPSPSGSPSSARPPASRSTRFSPSTTLCPAAGLWRTSPTTRADLAGPARGVLLQEEPAFSHSLTHLSSG
jgi:Endosomal/lysosomal potassium channel TMEM175